MNTYSCPNCNESLIKDKNKLRCPNCQIDFLIYDDIPNLKIDNNSISTEMIEYFDKLHFYESLPYLAGLYGFYGQINVKPIKKRVPLITILFKNLINEILDIEGKIALDVACGTGLYTRSIARKAKEVYGIDVSIGMLKSAQRYSKIFGLDNISFICSDIEKLPFKDNSFDGISCCFALHLFKNLNESLDEMHRVLVENGKLAGITHLKKGIWIKEEIYDIFIKKRQSHLFKINELKAYLENAGFDNFKYNTLGSMITFEAKKV